MVVEDQLPADGLPRRLLDGLPVDLGAAEVLLPLLPEVKVFLRPADQSEAALQKRADLAQGLFRQFVEPKAEEADTASKEDAGMVKITEEEFRIYSRAVLVVLTLRDLLQAMEEFKNE